MIRTQSILFFGSILCSPFFRLTVSSPTTINIAGLEASLFGPEISSSIGPYGLDNADCETKMYQVNADSTNMKFVNINQEQQNQSSATSLMLQFATSQSNFTTKYIDGTFSFTGSFGISGTLCTPKQGALTGSAIQLLVHGVGFDSSYWDFSFSPEYSYIRSAASYGYTTFRFDRLGTGQSETPINGFDTSQAATEISILRNIAKMLRDTTNVGGQQWSRVVGIGHSLGSVETQAVSASDPDLYDAVILQGFSANATNLPNYLEGGAYSIASQTLPDHLSDKPPTWLVTGSVASLQEGFFYFPSYDPGAFDLSRQTEQPVTLGTLFSVGSAAAPAPGFTNPVMVITGDKDFIFASSDAYAGQNGLTIPEEVQPVLYPSSSNFVAYIPANTGHAVNQHLSAPETFTKMLQFINDNGL